MLNAAVRYLYMSIISVIFSDFNPPKLSEKFLATVRMIVARYYYVSDVELIFGDIVVYRGARSELGS